MRLKTATQATDACQKALIRRGFKTKYSSQVLRLGGDKPGEVVYDAWFPNDGYPSDWSVEIDKGTAGPKNSIGWYDWDWTNTIKLRLV